MSNGFINLVWDYNADNSGQKLVLLALADHADKNGFCFPGTDKLSTKTGLSKRMVQYHLEALKTKGVVKIEYNQGTKTISGYTNKYQLVRGAMEFTPLEQGVQPTSPDGVQPTSPKPSVKPSVEPEEEAAALQILHRDLALKASAIVGYDKIYLTPNAITQLNDFTEWLTEATATIKDLEYFEDSYWWGKTRPSIGQVKKYWPEAMAQKASSTNGKKPDAQAPKVGKLIPVEGWTL